MRTMVMSFNVIEGCISNNTKCCNHKASRQGDCFAHLDLSFKFYALGGHVKGDLCQTYAINYVSKVKIGVVIASMAI